MKEPREILNQPDAKKRLEALRGLTARLPARPATPGSRSLVNNHIHTFFSFSPYSPTLAIWLAREAGLESAGIMDHDTVAGAEEFLEAGTIINLPTTVGVECRADFSMTALKGRSINHPDQVSTGYIALHGIPRTRLKEVQDFFTPLIKKRNARNKEMTGRLDTLLRAHGMALEFEKDVMPISQYAGGGVITERHLLYAAALKIEESKRRGPRLVSFLEEALKISLTRKMKLLLSDPDNPYYSYDLLGALKSAWTPAFYIPAREECSSVEEVVALAERTGSIMAYAYLGDVANSVTGDKKSQKFEDDYLDLLFDELKRLRFQAVTYMPTRNTPAQLKRVQMLCRKHGLLEISGEDINSPRQSFICEALSRPEFHHLIDMTWTLVARTRS